MLREKIAMEIGSAILSAHEAVHRAEQADGKVKQAEAEVTTERDKRVKAYSLLAQCIKSDQVPADEVQRIMNEDRHFAEWYESEAILPKP